VRDTTNPIIIMSRKAAYSDDELEDFVWNAYYRDGETALSRKFLIRELRKGAESAGRHVRTGDSERLQAAVNKVREELSKQQAANAAASNDDTLRRLPPPLVRVMQSMAHVAAEFVSGAERAAAVQTQVLLAHSANAFAERERELLATVESREERIACLQFDVETAAEELGSRQAELEILQRELDTLTRSCSADRAAYEHRVENLLADMRAALAARGVADEREQRSARDLETIRATQEATISTTVSVEREARQRADAEVASLRRQNVQLVTSATKLEAERDEALRDVKALRSRLRQHDTRESFPLGPNGSAFDSDRIAEVNASPAVQIPT